LDKLHKNEIAGIGSVAWPTYMIFKDRLVLKKFDDVKKKISFNADLLKKDIENNGLLCPMVIDENDQLTDGSDRLRILEKANIKGSFFYKARNKDEKIFFKKLNDLTWDEHPDMLRFMEKLWQGKMKKYTEKVTHLFTENIRTAIPK
tara:strand:- start:239 stop:679 length:441 start_codon:yes stop_codon:yes gene_type:complete